MTVLDALLAPGALSVVFQPILEAGPGGWRLFALEPLVRGPGGSNFESAEVLFNYVRRKNEQVAIDRACIAAIFTAARALPDGVALSVNVHAATFLRQPELARELLEAAAAAGVRTTRLIVEIVEDEARATDGFTGTLDVLRAAGVRIAVDDLGLGRSNLARLLDTRPDYIKLAPYFLQGCDHDVYRQAILRAAASLAEGFAGRVIAEGVETAGELETARAAGLSLFQGYLFARPRPWDALSATLGALAGKGSAGMWVQA